MVIQNRIADKEENGKVVERIPVVNLALTTTLRYS
jgi:hypothetical protein